MSAQRFGAIHFTDQTKETWLTLMTGTPLFDKTAMISICNQTNAPVTVYLAYVVDPLVTEPKPEDYLVFYKTIPIYGNYHHPALAVQEDARIMVWAGATGVSAIAQGYQDEI